MTDEAWRFSLLGYQAGFAQPWLLLLVPVVLGIAAVAIASAFRRRARVQAVLGSRFADALVPGISVFRPTLRSALGSAGLLFLAVALAQPECGSHAELTKRQGIDVVVALDASKSMLAKDVVPNRLERAKLELMTLLDELKGDRVALVVFAGEAFIQCPLTSDYEAAKLFLRAVDPYQMPQGGTNIGDALEVAKEVFDGADRGSKDRVVVLLSDGEDVFGDVKAGLKTLVGAGVKIYTVGIGSETGEPIPLEGKNGEFLGYQKDEHGETVLTRMDRANLADLAEESGGEFFYQPRGVAMREVVDRIDKLQKSDLESRIAVRFDERFQTYLAIGLALLVASMLTPTSRKVTPLSAQPAPAPQAAPAVAGKEGSA